MKDALIICTKSRSDHIDRWLHALTLIVEGPSLILIVDSNSSDKTLEIVKKHQTQSELNIAYIQSQSGLPFQRNSGIDYLRDNFKGDVPEIVHFLDDDVAIRSNYFTTINQLFEEFPSAIAIGGFDINTDINRSNGFFRRHLLLGSRHMGVVLRSGICIPPHPRSRVEVVEWLPGLSQSFRLQIFDQIRFDPGIYFYGEDIDFYLRLQAFGNIICSNELPVDHLHEQSDRDLISESIMYSDGSRWSLAHKYPNAISRSAVVFSTVVLLLSELMLGLLGRGRQHFKISVGHAWFFMNVLFRRKTEKLNYFM